MYTIIMDKYKNLNTTVRTTLFSQESAVDKIQFLIPPQYNEVDLTDYIVTLKYVDPNGNFHSEVLTLDAEMYKNYLRYELPVTTELTQVCGTLTLRLTLMKFSQQETEGEEGEGEDEELIVDRLETESTTITIQKPTGFMDYVEIEDIDIYTAQLAQLTKEVEDLSEKVPTDLEINSENQNLHLVHDSTQIGEGVEILQPVQFDELDDAKDGIFDVDNFVEL